ncbi:hypothetical protein HOD30_03620 [Candidatus Peregrinibacteria bacterium]|jgi:AbrB family looped-hinge helix DNA binding protein|nr:hypothetical protein [Candidatus Peregrinibacteria bacterium]MBT4631602.1 hypothetical protein [Candidatus Peregrinibacteria bacterium]MBT5516608.1 hypothetical protein [Candidatus Peregrinibacteria bacterium]MBT5823701.1 hypothetical protein [Candidatus Peregrinibacteria bacterium]
MDPSHIEVAKVMQNFTICIPSKIRKKLKIKKNDQMIVHLTENGTIELIRTPSNWEDLIGSGKNVFKQFGGGEAFLKAEREAWD